MSFYVFCYLVLYRLIVKLTVYKYNFIYDCDILSIIVDNNS